MAKSKPDDAKALWRRVLKMVPADSPWYYEGVRGAEQVDARSSSQDEDE
jgi:hypothetical protein